MRQRLSFKDVLARQGQTPDRSLAPSGIPTRYFLSARDVPRPIDAIRLLASFGMGLRKGSETLDRMFTSAGVAIELFVLEGRDAVAELAALGIAAQPLRRPAVAVADVRKKLGLSQVEFAIRFGLEIDTIQNWEQGRNRPDPAAMILLKVIEQNPAAVDAALVADAPAIETA